MHRWLHLIDKILTIMINRIAIMVVACAALILPQACNGASVETVRPSGKIISKTASIGQPFHAIEVLSLGEVVYNTGSQASVCIEGSDNLVPLVETMVDDGRLLIKYRGRGIRIVGDEDVTVYVTAPAVRSFEVKGSSSISINSRLDVAGEDATLTVNGSGDISVQAVSCRSFKGVVNGSGDLDINSRVDASGDLELTVNGSGNTEIDAISCKRGTVKLQGSGDISVDAVKASELAVTVNGSGDVECNEIAATTVKANLSGSGDIALDGKSENASLTASASGDISAEDLQADNVKALVNGSGEINCYAAKALDATINGSGEVRYGGSPRVTAHGRNSDNISRN